MLQRVPGTCRPGSRHGGEGGQKARVPPPRPPPPAARGLHPPDGLPVPSRGRRERVTRDHARRLAREADGNRGSRDAPVTLCPGRGRRSRPASRARGSRRRSRACRPTTVRQPMGDTGPGVGGQCAQGPVALLSLRLGHGRHLHARLDPWPRAGTPGQSRAHPIWEQTQLLSRLARALPGSLSFGL